MDDAYAKQSPTLQARLAQAFPMLEVEVIGRMRRFGTLRRFAAGESVYQTGKATAGLYVVLAGTIRITARDGHGHDVLIVEHGPGRFTGEVGQLSGRRALVDGVAVEAVEAL